jgi:hypothetical protein
LKCLRSDNVIPSHDTKAATARGCPAHAILPAMTHDGHAGVGTVTADALIADQSE